MSSEQLAQEVSDLIKNRSKNNQKSKRELLFDSSSDTDAETDYIEEDRLDGMTELEREAIIFEREQAKQAKLERMALEKRIKEMEKAASSQNDKISTYEEKNRKMELLRASKRKRIVAEDSDYAASEEEAEYSRNISDTCKIEHESILSIQFRREDIEKHMFRPLFKEVAKGTIVRVNVGNSSSGSPVYRACIVKDIVEGSTTYLLGKTKTNMKGKFLIGKSERICAFDITSNGPISKEEFEYWFKIVSESGLAASISKNMVKKARQLEKFVKSPIDEGEVKFIVEKKRNINLSSTSSAAAKAKLMIELEEAKALKNLALVNDIELRLKGLNESNASQNDNSLAQSVQQRRLFTGNPGNGGSEHDPFSRRKCKPSDDTFVSVSPDEKVEIVFTADSDKLGKDKELIKAAADVYLNHDFDLTLDL